MDAPRGPTIASPVAPATSTSEPADRRTAARVRLSVGDLDDLVADQSTFMAMFTAGRLDQPAGSLSDLLDWSLILRAVWDDQPIVLPSDVELRRPRRLPARPVRRRAASTTIPTSLRHALETAGLPAPDGRVHPRRDGAGVRRHGRRRASATSRATAARGGRAPPTASTDSSACRASTDTPPTTAALLDDTRLAAIGALPGDGHEQGKMIERQPHRGAVQADRHRGRDLRRPVAQGLQPRAPQLRVLLAHGRHLRDGRRRRVGAAPRRRRLASRHVLAGVRARRAPGCPRSTSPPAPATSPCTSAAPTTWPSRQSIANAACSTPRSSLPEADPASARTARDRLRRDREAAPVTVSQRPTTLH